MADPALSGIALVMTGAHPELLVGADVYLKEPFTLDDLLAALARCEERVRAAARRASSPKSATVDSAGQGLI